MLERFCYCIALQNYELLAESAQLTTKNKGDFAWPCLILRVWCVCVKTTGSGHFTVFRYQVQLSFATSSGSWRGAVRFWASWRVKLLPPSGQCQIALLEARQHADVFFFLPFIHQLYSIWMLFVHLYVCWCFTCEAQELLAINVRLLFRSLKLQPTESEPQWLNLPVTTTWICTVLQH